MVPSSSYELGLIFLIFVVQMAKAGVLMIFLIFEWVTKKSLNMYNDFIKVNLKHLEI